MIAPDTVLNGRYRILLQLGAGGMGEVYRAHDLRLGRDVAIKVLSSELAGDEVALARFNREAKALASLSHAHILAIHDFVAQEDLCFAVMELLEGETLRNKIRRGRIPWRETLGICISVAEGLAAAHTRGIIHRDLKPENIFLCTDGNLKILDFGLARIIPKAIPNESGTTRTRTLHTNPGVVVGTMHYMSPEQLRGEDLDVRTDLFSFGCILYECLVGVDPFSRGTQVETLAAILKEQPSRLIPSEPDFPVELGNVVERCLEKNRDERFQSARDLSFALQSIQSFSTPTHGFSSLPTEATRKPTKRKQDTKKPIDSLAVLPLSNVSGDPDAEYLSDGVTESIINTLAQLPGLRVMARSTVFRYKGQTLDPQHVGRELQVRGVLTGRVVQRGDILNIQVELVDASDGSQLWGERYTRKLADLIAIQEEISSEISEKLRLKLSGTHRIVLQKRHTESATAYEYFLRGRFYWNKRTSDGFQKAIDYFRMAVQEDPQYALAYSGLADCYNLISAYGMQPPHESVPLARDASEQALGIDPELAEAQEALGHVRMLYDWDWKEAERHYTRAIEINPNYATAHQRYAILLATLHRLPEAVKEINRAHEIDPLSLIIHTDVGLIQYLQGNYGETIAQCSRALDLDPTFSVAHITLGLAYEATQEYAKAVDAIEKGCETSGDRTFLSTLAHTYALAGEKEKAKKLLEELLDLSRDRYVSPYRISLVHTALGEDDAAIAWLEKACDQKSVWLIHLHLRVDPRFRRFRSDPRFQSILSKVGFPD